MSANSNTIYLSQDHENAGAFTKVSPEDILDLHGSSLKKEKPPHGLTDENVFDIQQGVAISIFVRKPEKKGLAEVHYAELWGKRETKYSYLYESDVKTTTWTTLNDIERSSRLGTFYFFRYHTEFCVMA